MFNKKTILTGSSIIEVLVAVGIFVIISVTAISAVIGSTNIGRLTQDQTKAQAFAEQGNEAVLSMKNRDWTLITTGIHGLAESGGNWIFSGSSDQDSSGKFTRTTTVETVQRNGAHVIVASGGTIDDNTKKITVSVKWQPSPNRNNNVQFVTYVTNWQLTELVKTSNPSVPTPTPTLPPGPTTPPTPTPTPGISTSCAPYCITNGYSTGTCRQNITQCKNAGEISTPGGNSSCQVPNSDTCCCKP
ncbi:MAG: hypothetical protein AUK08_03250 [Candidatus Pacebacteria bacterium CG2_30_36_39]|nr:MAG: hypothetical protein AUK08_03250 [Candidatus Pacebacteria bacterium CG2_30_36_39]